MSLLCADLFSFLNHAIVDEVAAGNIVASIFSEDDTVLRQMFGKRAYNTLLVFLQQYRSADLLTIKKQLGENIFAHKPFLVEEGLATVANFDSKKKHF
jgi:hypothetical protein